MSSSRLPSLYVVTDRTQVADANLLPVLEHLIPLGGIMLQLREKDLPTRILLEWARTIVSWCRRYQVPFLINDRVDIAMATDAHGVHLRESSLPVKKVRQCVGEHRLIGVSVHSIEEAIQQEKEGADFVVLGPIYDTPSKRAYGPSLGISVLEEATLQCHIPIYAIGGIDLSRVEALKKAGAYGVAVISSIFQSDSPGEAVKNYTTQLGVPI
ncbi:thiamine phosphate synthase [Candidatus Nitronereus thalassa]|uniref:Thiamine-phosphate synthase n=1 Tax=Candidatus Nitronereus thalassa TaxID=3020898 RepID=A0ABU3K3H2_9BACT|nr:thiamine phosphate synthase [Candidatus Nitronereus thalassa]MDT7040913.1 thiamine phosphate synthase [Candidatus Nitronereus thalassa]